MFNCEDIADRFQNQGQKGEEELKRETLFIDDLQINIEGARNVGLWAYHLENESITDLFVNESQIDK